jgi:hypothetical protein
VNFKRFLKEEATSLPPGFTADDVETLDQFYQENQPLKEAPIDDAEVSNVDIQKDILDVKAAGPKSDKAVAERPHKLIHNTTVKDIVDENGKAINLDVLKKLLSTRPKQLIAQNNKLKASGKLENEVFYDLTLPSYQGLYFDEKANDFKIVKTCPSAGDCKKYCYAARGMYIVTKGSGISSSRTVGFLLNDYDGFKAQLLSEINKENDKANKKGKKMVLRWHDSGDFISEKYMLMAFEIAKAVPTVQHYAYTKQIPMVRKLEEHKPKNFTFNFSLGGLHDDLIGTKDKKALVVPKELFKSLDYEKTDKTIVFTPEALTQLKKNIAKHYNLEEKSIITWDELIQLPKSDEPKYNVLVWKGHGDDAANRKDVIGTYLLFH